jgi:hypothetical protein
MGAALSEAENTITPSFGNFNLAFRNRLICRGKGINSPVMGGMCNELCLLH